MVKIEEIQQIIQKIPFANYLGIQILEAESGTVTGRIKIIPEYNNIYSGLHGGIGYSLGDTIAAMSAYTVGVTVTTINSSFHYLAPGVETEYIDCVGKVIRCGKRITVANVELYNDSHELLMTGEFTFYNLYIKNSKKD